MTTQQRTETQRTDGGIMPQTVRKSTVERQSSKIPSGVFVLAAFGSIAGSAYLKSQKKNELSLFVGQWAPTFVAFGIYNKLIQLLEVD